MTQLPDLYMHSSIDMVAVRIPRNTLSIAVTCLRCFLVCVCVCVCAAVEYSTSSWLGAGNVLCAAKSTNVLRSLLC